MPVDIAGNGRDVMNVKLLPGILGLPVLDTVHWQAFQEKVTVEPIFEKDIHITASLY